ncbi:hypothetical protein [Microviridae sp.]|nr:hypothetical protein [Microviridae sp.]
MKPFNYPDKTAKSLAVQLKKFRARTEKTAYSEVNPHAESDRIEVIKKVDWDAYNALIDQLEFTYDKRKQNGR